MSKHDLPDEFRVSCCEGKERMSRGIARKVAKRMKSKGRMVESYRCDFCGEFHVGRPMPLSNREASRKKARSHR